jgi:hypothetical protein
MLLAGPQGNRHRHLRLKAQTEMKVNYVHMCKDVWLKDSEAMNADPRRSSTDGDVRGSANLSSH